MPGPTRILGLMSGTSLDGIDAALVEFSSEPHFQWKLLSFYFMPWEEGMRKTILNCCRPDAALQQITVLNYLLGECFAEAAVQAVHHAGLAMQEVEAIASHGQTIWHQPEPLFMGRHTGRGTLQLGEPAVIAARTGRPVIANFRSMDMALGGQGAPLVPYADWRLLAHPAENRLMLNLGGIANVTLLPAGGSLQDVLAFDTGPGNMLMDALASAVTQGKWNCDRDGALAAAGKCHPELLAECMAHPFLQRTPPRSTGREMFGAEYASWLLQRAHELELTPSDILHTATRFTADSVLTSCRNWAQKHGPIHTVIAGGGGVRNPVLMQMLEEGFAPSQVCTHARFGIPDDAKEALAFALLGYETLQHKPCNVPAATGASRPAILGQIQWV